MKIHVELTETEYYIIAKAANRLKCDVATFLKKCAYTVLEQAAKKTTVTTTNTGHEDK